MPVKKPAKKIIPLVDPFEGKCVRCTLYRAEKDEEFGLCHRYPPIAMIDEGETVFAFPVLGEDDFCGEFRPLLS